jgi:hypothetical protein
LHNKPHGCSASVASATGSVTTKKTHLLWPIGHNCILHFDSTVGPNQSFNTRFIASQFWFIRVIIRQQQKLQAGNPICWFPAYSL